METETTKIDTVVASDLPPEMQLVLRNEVRIFEGTGPTLVVDAPDLPSIAELARPNVEFWCRHHGLARSARGRFPIRTGALWSPPADRFERVLMFLPKGRRLQRMTLAWTRAALPEGAPVFVVGANQAGIKGARSAMTDIVGPVASVDAARRCTLLSAPVSGPRTGFDPHAWRRRWTARVQDRAVDVVTYPGTFSESELDEGTKILLEVVGRPPGARVLDLGCGSGVIGAMVAKYAPDTEVVLVDANAAAVASATATVAANDLTNAAVRSSDWYSDVGGRFDTILCNPPFHEGVATNRTLVAPVIAGAPRHLAPGGCLWLVANRFLPYLDALRATFTTVNVARAGRRFNVYCARAESDGLRYAGSRKGSSRKR